MEALIRESRDLQKNKKVQLYLSLEFSLMPLGARVPSRQSLSHKMNVSIGLVQNVLAWFEENNIVRLQKRGHLGAFLEYCNREICFELNKDNILYCAMPLPYTLRYEALASAIAHVCREHIPFFFTYMRGALPRLGLVKTGRMDACIISAFAWHYHQNQEEELQLAYSFGKGTYLSRHVLFLRKGLPMSEVKKVGIDPQSPDHELISREAFSNFSVEFVPVPYHHLVYQIQEGLIDATIRNQDEKPSALFDYQELPIASFKEQASEAVLIIRKDNIKIKNVIECLFKKENLDRHIDDIMQGHSFPFS